ncbi:MBL fold metallo-hydrolase [Neobacillus sp. SM06]|uniref:MBL fold metallo-hydrolase n=1 Tax=Neobacillus sp. SM06 TaxID=3422492 RepID=UPI003D2E9600
MTEWKNGIAKLTVPTPYAVGDVNMYVIKGDRLTLIDAAVKTEDAWAAFKEQLASLHLRPEDIEQVVLTHHHPDHVGLLDFMPDSVELYGHPFTQRWLDRTEEFLHQHDAFYEKLWAECGVPAELFLNLFSMKKTLKYSCSNQQLTGTIIEGDRPPGMDDWLVIETPGHAQSHMSFFREKDGIMIGGDHILAHVSPNPLMEPPVPGSTERPKPILQYHRSLKKLFDYPIQFVYTGHGEEVYQLAELIEKRMMRQHERAMTVKGWLEQEELTVFEICKRLFPTVYQKEFALTMSETVAQLDYLSSIGEISSKGNPPYLFSAVG